MKGFNVFAGFISLPFFRYYLIVWAILSLIVTKAGFCFAVKMVSQRRKFEAEWKQKKKHCLDFGQKLILTDRSSKEEATSPNGEAPTKSTSPNGEAPTKSTSPNGEAPTKSTSPNG